ncbi:MAG TPA: Ig-like domain-containing protein [Gemmatimonadales bacterium]|nr:Ig-like domain-containing protein [Gemmatimonadales bacterium]
MNGRRLAGAILALAIAACAKMEPPPGGPPDRTPPGLIATIPDSLAVLPDFSGDVEFLFNETVSEGGSPNMGLGTGDLEKLVILSPSERVPKVRWKRSRVTVRPAEGWRPNTVYRVQLLPGVMDIRRNRYDSTRVVTFTTGAPLPTLRLTGQVWDWMTARPAPQALVVAVLLPDSLQYRMLADSAGKFDFGPLPSGDYLVYGAIDQNKNARFERREAWDSIPMPRDSSAVPELWVFQHDSIGPRLSKAAVTDSLSASLTFTQPLDPTQRFAPGSVRVLLLPDSVAVEVLSLLPREEHDSLYRPPPPPRDSNAAQPLKAPAAPVVPPADSAKPARAPLYTALLLRVAEAWKPGSTYVIEVDSIRNANGAGADVRGPLEVPAAKPDTAAAPADSTSAPADSTPTAPDSTAPSMPKRDSASPTPPGR